MSEQLLTRGQVQAHLLAEANQTADGLSGRPSASPMVGTFLRSSLNHVQLLLDNQFEYEMSIAPALVEDQKTVQRATIHYQVGGSSGTTHIDLPTEATAQ
jgi:hypothetical protein